MNQTAISESALLISSCLAQDDLGLGELAAPAVVVAVEPAVARDQPVEAQPGAVADVARRDDVAGADGARQPMRVPVVAAARPLRDGDGRPGRIRGWPPSSCRRSVSSASSQRDALPLALALSPALFMGYWMRSGWLTCWMLESPLEHIVPLVSESGLPSMWTMTPSSTVTMHAAAAVAALARREDLLAIRHFFPFPARPIRRLGVYPTLGRTDR